MTYLDKNSAYKETRSNVGQTANSALAEILAHKQHGWSYHRMPLIAGGPDSPNKPQDSNFRNTGESSRIREAGSLGEPSGEVPLHDHQF